jgi:hypothetical protein
MIITVGVDINKFCMIITVGVDINTFLSYKNVFISTPTVIIIHKCIYIYTYGNYHTQMYLYLHLL